MYNNTQRNWNIRDDSTIFDMMRKWQNLAGMFDPMFDEMTKNFDFTVARLQWEKEVREKLEAEKRPANSYNLLRTIFNVILNIELENRKEMVSNPKSGGDLQLAQKLTKILFHFLHGTKFNYQRTKVFLDSIVGRLGVYFVNWIYENDKKYGELFVEAVDPREIIYEPVKNDPLWIKSNYLFRKNSMSLEEILNKYALNDEELQEELIKEAQIFFESDEENKRGKWVSKRLKALFSAVFETATGFSSTSDNLFKNYLNWWDPTTGKFDVLELHEKRTERILLLYDSNSEKMYDFTEQTREDNGIRFSRDKINIIKEHYGKQGYRFDNDPKVDLDTWRYTTAVVPTFNCKVNEQRYPFKSKYYVYIPQKCYDHHQDPLKVQSVMDDLMDPQAHFNKAQSLKLELLGRYANKGWIMDENAIDGLEEDWSSQRIAPYRRVRAGYINHIKPEEGQTINPDLVRDPLETQQLMKVISNADDEIRGQRAPGIKSGKHFIAKEEKQTKSFSYLFDNVNNSAIAIAELSIDFIQHYVRAPQIFRITEDVPEPIDIAVNQVHYSFDPNAGRYIHKIVNDLSIGKYDITISDAPISANAKEMEYNKLVDLFNATISVNPKKADALLNVLVEAGSFPDAYKILKIWKELDQPSPQQQQLMELMTKIQMIMAKLGVEEKKEDIIGKKLDNQAKVQQMKLNVITAKQNALGALVQRSNGKSKPKQLAA